MGRSVMTLSGAITAYQEFSPAHYCDIHDVWSNEDEAVICDCDLYCDSTCDHRDDYQDILDWIADRAIELWPSFERADRWIGDELHVIAENSHSLIAVAEYGNLISVNLGANYDRDTFWRDPEPGLGEHWRKQIEKKFLATFGEYEKMGTFSNGESVYQKVS